MRLHFVPPGGEFNVIPTRVKFMFVSTCDWNGSKDLACVPDVQQASHAV